MYEKEFPRESTNTTIGDPCILMDSYFFIWTSIMLMFAGIKGRRMRMNNEEDQRS
jgi:hypothetical protein